MALVLADRVLETCTSPGTGAVTLLGATTGYQPFSAGVGNGNSCYYCIADQGGANWEVGIGTYSSVGNTLTRTAPLSGSATTPVNFSSGTQNVFVTYPAEKSVNLDENGKLRADSNSYLDFNSTAPSVAAGRMWYNGTTGAWNLGMGGGNITQQVGEELYVYGEASGAISGNTLLQLIFKTGVDPTAQTLIFAPTTSGITDSNLILGVATEDIGAGAYGRISTFGIVHGINTTGATYSETWANGDVLWYNPTTGGITKTKPSAPNIKYQVGTVLVAAASGAFQIDLQQGSELGGTDSNVQFGTLSSGNLVQYNGTYWTNVAPSSLPVVTSFSAGTTGLTPNTATTGAVTLGGTLGIANGGTGQTSASAAFNALSPITTTGDLIVGNGSNSATRLGIGANNYVLTSNGTTASWQAPSGAVGPLVYNTTEVTSNITLAAGQNAFSVGPITIDSGVSVTVPSGQRWVVI